MQDDLLVVGFALETEHEVHVAEQPPEHWRQRGYGGTRQLVCFCRAQSRCQCGAGFRQWRVAGQLLQRATMA